MNDQTNSHDGYGGVARENHQVMNDNQIEDSDYTYSCFVDDYSASIGAAVLARELKKISEEVSRLCGISGLSGQTRVYYESVVANAAAALRDLSNELAKGDEE